VSTPNPYEQYYTYNEATLSYSAYYPVTAEWTTYYEEPTETLYSYHAPTDNYFIETEPSPYVSYYTYDATSNAYVTFEPVATIEEPTSTYYEEPSVTIYAFDECTSSYYPVDEPTWEEEYYFIHPETNSYTVYQPTPAIWTDYFEQPTVPLYTYEEGTNVYTTATDLTPFDTTYYYGDREKDLV
jgi:hypothetical protein